jgi:RNA 3'-terminal phosphate cyclase (ATP)
MMEIDGARFSGSGTILRYSMVLSALLGKTLILKNIRARRNQPGLRPQHLRSTEAVATLCDGKVSGAQIGATKIFFEPGSKIKGGCYEFDIGTAGSTTMLALTILPLLIFADKGATVRIKGGVFQDFAPSALHMQYVLFPLLRRMGVKAELHILRPGYVPKGGGMVELKVEPSVDGLNQLSLLHQGEISSIKGISFSSHLQKRGVSNRMAAACKKHLKGLWADITCVDDQTASQPGAALCVYARTSTKCLLGADRAGAPGRTSERIGEDVARALLKEIKSGATVDIHCADQLIMFCSLANGVSEYRFSSITDHIQSNLWLVEEYLGAEVELQEGKIRIKGVGFPRRKFT